MYVNEEFESMYLREYISLCVKIKTQIAMISKNIGTRWKYHAVNMQKVTKIRYGC